MITHKFSIGIHKGDRIHTYIRRKIEEIEDAGGETPNFRNSLVNKRPGRVEGCGAR